MSGFIFGNDPAKYWQKALQILRKYGFEEITPEMVLNPLKTLTRAVSELTLHEEWSDGLMVEVVDENESGTT